jgi:hypothetical protein
MFLSLSLIAIGGLSLLLARQNKAVVRRFSSPAIQSASALRGAARGQAVILGGRIDPATPVAYRGLVMYEREQQDPPPPVSTRYGSHQSREWTWGRTGGFHPPFTLVTGGERVPIINRRYTIEGPAWELESGRTRHVGFKPDDRVIVVGESQGGGVAASKVFGGKRAEFQKNLDEQEALIPVERVVGGLLSGIGLLLLARCVASRIENRHRAMSVRGDNPSSADS